MEVRSEDALYHKLNFVQSFVFVFDFVFVIVFVFVSVYIFTSRPAIRVDSQ